MDSEKENITRESQLLEKLTPLGLEEDPEMPGLKVPTTSAMLEPTDPTEPIEPATTITSKKRKRDVAKIAPQYDELPHGLGKMFVGPQQEAASTATARQLQKNGTKILSVAISDVKSAPSQNTETAEASSIKIEKENTEASGAVNWTEQENDRSAGDSAKRHRGSRLPTKAQVKIEAKTEAKADDMAVDGNSEIEKPVLKRQRVKKANKYGVTLGQSPYENLEHPTQAECQQVNDLLTTAHGYIGAPASIPLPSLTVAGCGEVPCILEALLRTLLSAHTSSSNAALAIQGAIQRYGILPSGPSQGCLDWNAARLSSREEVEKAIKRGGMGPSKSKSIKAILDMVYEENQQMRRRIARSKGETLEKTGHGTGKAANDSMAVDDQKAAAIEQGAEAILTQSADVLTLDYMHAMSANDAFAKFLTLPGIGVKTAACTLLFCMQRPLFAVDTHVYRLCKWLGWVPANATRDSTFAHCDVRVPDHLKYSLHQLLIRHGKQCLKCQANTGPASEGWQDCECVIENLVQRTGNRKSGVPVAKKKKATKVSETETEDEDEAEDEEQAAVPKKTSRRKAAKAKTVKVVEAKPSMRRSARSSNTATSIGQQE